MTLEQALRQLQSTSTQGLDGVARHILRGGFGRALPDALAERLAERWRNDGPLEGVAAAVVTDFPSTLFAPLYRVLLARGGPEAKARALQRVRPWLETKSVRFDEIEPAIYDNTTSDSLWIRFLSWLQLAHYGAQRDLSLARVVDTIIEADQAGLPQSIRDRAVEVLSADELASINRELAARDSRTLMPPKWPTERNTKDAD